MEEQNNYRNCARHADVLGVIDWNYVKDALLIGMGPNRVGLVDDVSVNGARPHLQPCNKLQTRSTLNFQSVDTILDRQEC